MSTSPTQSASKELLNKIESLVETQQVRKGVHPRLPLAIYNYSAAVQWRDEWDDTLMQCRGLVLDSKTGEIVACPMRKFFNYADKKHDASAMKMENCDVLEKLDGSLGILFKDQGEWIFASRGSFISTHAQKGMEMAKEKGILEKCKEEFTYMFEMIYPDNRIVVNYGDRTDLVLIAMVHTRSSLDLALGDVVDEAKRLGLSTPRIHDSTKTYESLQSQNVKNEEGYIIRSRISGERVKLKFNEYVEIHAIRTRFSLRHVRQWFLQIDPHDSNPQIPPARLEYIPDEVFKVAGTEWNRLVDIRQKAIDRFNEALKPCLEMEFRNVPNGPMKGWVCKYLRLIRGDQREEANLIANQYAMCCIKDAPDAPEVTSVERDEGEGEEHGE
jgi:RNA ligase